MDNKLGRRGCCDGTKRAQRHQPAVGERQSLRWKPEHDALESRHQGQGHAKPQQSPADHQTDQTLGQREHESADTCEQQEAALDDSWPLAVEQCPEGQLHGGEDKKVDRGQDPQIRGAKPSSDVRSPAIRALMVRNRYER